MHKQIKITVKHQRRADTYQVVKLVNAADVNVPSKTELGTSRKVRVGSKIDQTELNQLCFVPEYEVTSTL